MVYGYDANGNITSANNRTFTYDLSNRLSKLEDNGVTIAQYVYNGLNQRIKKILPGETRIFHYDIMGHLIAETTEPGQTLVEYFYLGDQPFAMIRPGEILYYYHNDHLGTPQILTNDSGTVSWKAIYGPFGEAEITIGTVENPFRFPGQYYDQETGLHYNWNRYYDPKTGRYLIPDPIGLEGGINMFVYVRNNPLSWIDPKGLDDYYYRPMPNPKDIIEPCVIQPRWKPAGGTPTPAIAGKVGGQQRTGGILCTCVWERIGFEKVCKYSRWNIVREPYTDPSISTPLHNIETTTGWWTGCGCSCPDPNGELR